MSARKQILRDNKQRKEKSFPDPKNPESSLSRVEGSDINLHQIAQKVSRKSLSISQFNILVEIDYTRENPKRLRKKKKVRMPKEEEKTPYGEFQDKMNRRYPYLKDL